MRTTLDRRRLRFSVRASIAVALISMVPLLSIPVAAEQPAQGAHITGIEHVTDRWDKVSVYSPSMDKVIVNDVGVAVYVAASASSGAGAVDRLPEGFGPNITGGLIERILELHHRTGPGGVARLRSRALRSATGIQQINSNTPGYLHVLAEDLALVC